MREVLLAAFALAVVLAPAAHAMEHEGKKEVAPVAAPAATEATATGAVEATATGEVKAEEGKKEEVKTEEKKEEKKEEVKH